MKISFPHPKVIAKRIRLPLSAWPGNCYGVACSMVEEGLVGRKARPVYGHYLGPVAQDSMFYARSNIGFCRHGWIELENGVLVDPTRWVFESARPYIFQDKVPHAEYDEGGNKWLRANLKPSPPFDKKLRTFKVPHGKQHRDLYAWVSRLVKLGKGDLLSVNQLHWLCTLPLGFMDEEDDALHLYEWVDHIGVSGLIPIDNFRRVMGVK